MNIYFLICESCYLVLSIIQNGKGVEKCESLGLTPTEFLPEVDSADSIVARITMKRLQLGAV